MRRSWRSFHPASVHAKYIVAFHANSGIIYDLALSLGGQFRFGCVAVLHFGLQPGSLTVYYNVIMIRGISRRRWSVLNQVFLGLRRLCPSIPFSAYVYFVPLEVVLEGD
jgi:hypothetical protein